MDACKQRFVEIMTQYFFADESGEVGFRKPRGSPYYILVMVQTSRWESIDVLSNLRRGLHLRPSFEFHYAKLSPRQKQAFYQAIRYVPFRVRAAVALKDTIPKFFHELSGLEMTIELFTQLVLRASPLDIGNDILVIDAATDAFRSKLRIRLSEECRKINRVRPFKKIATAKSHQEDGLQLADMVAGAIREMSWGHFSDYYHTFSEKVVDLWMVK